MYGIALFVLLPLLGWWLIRTTRSFYRLTMVLDENDVDLGFLSFAGKTSVLLLFSDVRFLLWLARRKYQNMDFPSAVIHALDEARRNYLLIAVIAAMALITVFAKAASSP